MNKTHKHKVGYKLSLLAINDNSTISDSYFCNMSIVHLQIQPEQLPSIEHIDWKTIDKKYQTVAKLVLATYAILILSGIVLVFFLADKMQTNSWYLSAGIAYLVLVALGFILTKKDIQNRAYAIRERDLLFRRGWWKQTIQAVTYNKIQHVSINKGPYERIFKLATIKIYTAGSSFSDIKITGLQEDVAEQIKTFILQQNAASEQL